VSADRVRPGCVMKGEIMGSPRTSFGFSMRLLAAAALACFALSCGASKDMSQNTAEEQFDRAKKRYDLGRHFEAVEQFKVLLAQFPGSKYAEPATFFLGKSRFASKEYVMAEVEFERIMRDFPRGEYVEEAMFMLGMCAYEQRRPPAFDQTAANRAIQLFRAYLSAYPDGAFVEQAQEKLAECRSQLAEKLHANGVLYLKLHDPKAARLSFEEVLAKYEDLHWADRALLGIAKSFEQEKEWAKAAEAYQTVVERNGDAETLGIAKERLRKLKDKADTSGSSG
jgi:outer membrane protein assembly factor BamD